MSNCFSESESLKERMHERDCELHNKPMSDQRITNLFFTNILDIATYLINWNYD